jgi:Rrf2 family protein
MRLSQTCGHALRALDHLAAGGGGKPVASGTIAEERGLPESYLMKALKPLVSAGLLRSLRGPNGGYSLARPLSKITLLEVVEAVDGPLRGEAPSVGEAGDGVDSRLRAVCERVAGDVRRRLRQVRLSDLAGKSRGGR